MKLTSVRIKNFKSIKDSGEIFFSGSLFVLAGQNESGKSSILEALEAYETEKFDKDNINFEEEQGGNKKQEILCTYEITQGDDFVKDLQDELREKFSLEEIDFLDQSKLERLKSFTICKEYDHKAKNLTLRFNGPTLDILKSALKDKENIKIDESGSIYEE